VVTIYCCWLLFARLYYGTFWPQALSLHPGEDTVEQTLLGIGRQVRWAWAGDGALIVAFLAAAVLGGQRLWTPQREARRLLPWAWVVLLPALLAARGVVVESRHLLLVLPIAQVLVWRAVEVWWTGGKSVPEPSIRLAALGGALAVLVAIPNLEIVRRQVLPDVRASSEPVRRQLLPWGARLGRLDDREPIATPLVGAIGWASQRSVLDLTGQLSPRIALLRIEAGERDLIGELTFRRVARAHHLVVHAEAESLLMNGRYRDGVRVVERGGGLTLLELDWELIERADAEGTRRP
jgi:hypothetical protein